MSQKILHDRRLRDVLVYGSIRWRKSDPKPMQACIHGKGGDHSFKFKFFPKKERKHEEAYPKMETHVKLQKIKKPTSPTSNREKKVSMQKKEEE